MSEHQSEQLTRRRRHRQQPLEDTRGASADELDTQDNPPFIDECSKGDSSSQDQQSSTMDVEPGTTETPHESRCALLKATLWSLFCLLSVFAIVDLVFIPSVFYLSSTVRQKIIFWNFVDYHPVDDFTRPQMFGLECSTNRYLTTEDGIALGVWYIPAAGSCEMFTGNRPVVIFAHGNAASRAGPLRLEKYIELTKLGMDVVAFDYRGYGDSTGVPTAEGLVTDAFTVYRDVRKAGVPAVNVILWGHSLGTGVMTIVASRLNETFGGLVLETPFDRIGNVLRYHRLAYPLRLLPCFDRVYVDSLNDDPTTRFNSIEAASKISDNVPILILAAQDDNIVPHWMAGSLHTEFLRARNKSYANLEYVLFDEKFGYGHMKIHRSPAFAKIVKEKVIQYCCKAH